MDLLDRIKIAADRRGTTLAELSRALGFSNKTIYRWSESSPRLEHLVLVADYLNVSIDWLAGRADDSGDIYTSPIELVAIEDVIESAHPLSFGDKEMREDDRIAIEGFMRNYFMRDPRGQARIKQYSRKKYDQS